ncbi:MAG: hypothetical protein WCV90_06145 [Candidatus Woesearchaeota archaeon]|jgi:hypothetical protein
MSLRNALIGLAGLVTVACGGAIGRQQVEVNDPNCRVQVISPEVKLVECVDPKTGEQIIAGYENGINLSEAVYDARGSLLRVNIYEFDSQGRDRRIYRIGSDDGKRIPYQIDNCVEGICGYQGEGHLFKDNK